MTQSKAKFSGSVLAIGIINMLLLLVVGLLFGMWNSKVDALAAEQKCIAEKVEANTVYRAADVEVKKQMLDELQRIRACIEKFQYEMRTR